MKYEFSENLQRGVLYLLKSNRGFYLQIVNLVQPEYFDFPVHARIFSIVRDHYEEYLKLPNDEIIIEEARKEKVASESLSDYEDEILMVNGLDASSLENPDYLLDLVEDFARKASMKEAIKDSIGLLKEDRIEEIEEKVRKALTVCRTVDYGQVYFPSIKDRWKRVFDEDFSDRYGTFLPSLNRVLEGGLSAKELAMVVAPPGVGKSLFLVNQSVEALMEGRKVLYLSLEMSEDKIAQRFDSVMTLVPQTQLKTQQNVLYERIEQFCGRYPSSQLVIKQFPTGQATVNSVRALLVQLKNYEDFEPDLIVIDYLELMRPSREGMAEYQAQQRISEEFRGLAVENDCLVWTATQTNRQGRSVKVITDVELADAYGKIRTCDFALSLNQNEEEFENGFMRAYVMKSRNSHQRFIVPINVNYGTLRMTESMDIFEEEED
tara:strand:- start:1599 stop:2903 length:1305 start_codon:yes stop_codon:yes gene_type:complete